MKQFVLFLVLSVVTTLGYGVGVSYKISDMTSDENPIATDEIEIQGTGASTAVEKTTLGLLGRSVKGGGIFTLTGSIDPDGTTSVVGVGTLFSTELMIGDQITVINQTRTVTAISDNTNLTVDEAFSDNVNDQSPDRVSAILTYLDSSGTSVLGMTSDGDLHLGGVPPTSEEFFKITLPAAKAIVIDGSTNIRTIDTGAFRMEHKPGIPNTRPITINVDINSQENTHAFVANLTATGLAAGEVAEGFSVHLDKNAATGGTIRGLNVDTSGVGSATALGLHAGIGVDLVHQFVGTLGNLEQVHTESGGFYVDITSASASTVTDVTMFAADDDALYMGDAATFNELQFNLETNASGGGIAPTFEFSIAGPGWTVFTPTDDTNGMRQNGNIFWLIGDLSAWAATATPPALGSVTITGGSVSAGVNKIDGILVNAVEVMNGSEDFDTDNATTATNIAASIVAKTSSPNYTAYSTGAVITIQAVATGTGPNGFVVVTDEQGDVTVTDVNMAGGTADKFQVRITRTRNTLTTAPVEDTIQIALATEYGWDSSGDITANAIDATGVVSGSFVGKQTIFIPAGAMLPTVSNGSSLLTQAETTAGRPDQNVLDFDDAADEHAQFQVALPKSWNLGTVTFQVYWTSTATDTDGVAWGLQGVATSDGDTIDVAYGTAVVVTDDVQSAAEDTLVTAESTAITIAGTPADDDMLFFRVFRDVSDGNDDMTEDARLIGIKLFITTDALNDS